jgi:hypothetical protein
MQKFIISVKAKVTGNFVGAFRPGANIYRNDYGPRNTTIYNGR